MAMDEIRAPGLKPWTLVRPWAGTGGGRALWGRAVPYRLLPRNVTTFCYSYQRRWVWTTRGDRQAYYL